MGLFKNESDFSFIAIFINYLDRIIGIIMKILGKEYEVTPADDPAPVVIVD